VSDAIGLVWPGLPGQGSSVLPSAVCAAAAAQLRSCSLNPDQNPGTGGKM